LKDRPHIRNSTELIDRILSVKENLRNLQQNNASLLIDDSLAKDTTSINKGTVTNLDSSAKGLPILVREDGTVDWDGAWQSRKEVAKFGAELWERVNGKDEGIPSLSELLGQIQAPELETLSIIALKEKLERVKSVLGDVLMNRNLLKENIRQSRKQNKPVDEGDVEVLFRLDLRVRELEKLSSMLSLDLNIERICVYLEQEIESSIDPNEQRQFVAEVALIDRQFSGLFANLQIGSIGEVSSLADVCLDSITMTEEKNEELLSLVDDDELSLLIGEVSYLHTIDL
jgi:hypothetical protein